jgi:hypothetical protein
MKRTEMSRRQAAKFIEDVLLFVAQLEEGEVLKNNLKQRDRGLVGAEADIGNRLRTIASTNGITDIPRKCTGEAHDPQVGGQIDNCGSCMSHWGWVTTEVKIR